MQQKQLEAAGTLNLSAWRDGPFWRGKGGQRSEAIDPTHRHLAMITGGTIDIWDLERYDRIARWQTGNNTELVSLDFSNNGDHLAIGGRRIIYSDQQAFISEFTEEGVLFLVDLTGEPPQLEGPLSVPGKVASVLFSPDDHYLATGGCGAMGKLHCTRGFVALRDMRTGMMLGEPMPSHARSVTSLAFSADGELLVSAPKEGRLLRNSVDLLLRDLRPQTWIKLACEKTNRPLSAKEAARFFGDPESEDACSAAE